MTLQEIQVWLKEKLEPITSEWEIESKWMLCQVLDCSVLDLIIYKQQDITEKAYNELLEMVRRRILREPIQYILGVHEFMGLPFKVGRGVLIPRQDTESLVEYIIQYVAGQPTKILDIGTGSGAIAVSLARFLKYAEVTTVDISEDALEIAGENVRLNGVEARVTLLKSDLFESVGSEVFDIIVSNPPYISEKDLRALEPEVKDHEPELALLGGLDGLDFYRRIIPQAKPYLKAKGLLIFEAGYDQSVEIIKLFEAQGYDDIGVFSDLRGIPRFIYGHFVNDADKTNG
ncbi:peptide chain release factor N(5)-glutamine methyltransferase [Fusibacter sp. 3D3]|uniref:peptide chain release factor N(5)-glutamine methyltransferase n=1 Tax=Fusibacter sp. 3D3 TaxID=1048380 RepID=UPI0008530074|nr:peptide chain release factor N(5)-glutamine methyltransferase [Fusibacter sp. 3D3]GAU75726.1 protein-N(5)-glutamine methyltransferase PrmC [Fusibacter sp. 3D3]